MNSLNKTSTNVNNTCANMNANNQYNMKAQGKANTQEQMYSERINRLVLDQSVMEKKVGMYQKRIN
jgi:hypothetical protein